MITFLLAISLFSSSWALEPRLVESTLRMDLQPPEEVRNISTRNVIQTWIQMPLDHFDPQNSATFLMRYMYNEEFFAGDGSPIFIMVGGEWTIAAGWLLTGNMYEMARENGGYQIYTEHRYYGATLPFTNFTTENLRYLNIDQALADLAYFIMELKKMPRFADSKVILYGGSYAANMAMWFKKKYPHLVVGSVASSGPILAEVDFTGYLEVVHRAFLTEGGETCIAHIRRGIDDTIAAMQTESGRRLLEESYRMCGPMDYDNRFEMGYFSGLISWSFSSMVQYAAPETILNACNNFNANNYGATPMAQLGGFIAAVQGLGQNGCWLLNYENYVAGYQQSTNSRAWYYQTCTEYGYYQTAPRSGTVFDRLTWLSVEFYVDLFAQYRRKETSKQPLLDQLVDEETNSHQVNWNKGRAISDSSFDEEFVYDAADRVNLIFGGLNPEVNNTINIHGVIDPWRALGVYDRDVGETSPTYDVERASHCFDMQPWRRTDTIKMTNAQQAARRIVASWLSS